jgi:hypothetical protein
VLKNPLEAKKAGPLSGRTQGGNTSKKEIKFHGKRKPVFPHKQKRIKIK